MILPYGTSNKIPFKVTDQNNDPVTGDAANISCQWSKAMSSPVATTNSPAELDATNMPGIYYVELTSTETSTTHGVLYPVSSTSDVYCSEVVVSFIDLSNLDVTVSSRLAAVDYTAPDNAGIDTLESRLTATRAGYLDNLSGGAVALEATVQSIKTKTDNLPTDPADESLIEAAINTAVSTIRGTDGDTLKTLSDQIDGVQADLDNPSQYKADVSGLALEANIQSHVTAALLSYDPPTRDELTSDKNDIINTIDGLNNISITDVRTQVDEAISTLNDLSINDIMNSIVEGTLTFNNVIRIMLSALAGKVSGAGTTSITFRDTTDSKNRIVATVDENGNRTSITLNGS